MLLRNSDSRLKLARANRIHQLVAVALVAAVGVGGSSAATGPSVASANEAWQRAISIHTKGKAFGRGGVRGTFTLSVVRSRNGSRWRVIADRGTFVQRDLGRGVPSPRIVCVLVGTKGSLAIRMSASQSSGRWYITEGSRAFLGLRGDGTWWSHRELARVGTTMKGTVRR